MIFRTLLALCLAAPAANAQLWFGKVEVLTKYAGAKAGQNGRLFVERGSIEFARDGQDKLSIKPDSVPSWQATCNNIQ